MVSGTLTQAALFTERRETGSQSRSTSAGSSSSQSMFSTWRSRGSREATAKLEEIEYPQPLLTRGFESSNSFEELEYPGMVIKNTFLDTPVEHVSLDGFFQQREIHSCPPGALSGPEAEEEAAQHVDTDTEELPVTPFPSYLWERQVEPPAVLQQLFVVNGMPPSPPASPSVVLPPPPATWAPAFQPMDVVPPPPMAPADKARPSRVVNLSEAAFAPVIGSPECPTVGSVGHRFGTCKPCAFMHTKGCDSGLACAFCHICDKGERKRRQKQKHQAIAREAREAKARGEAALPMLD